MQLCTEVLVNKIERRWTSFSPNSIIIRPYIWTRKPILFRFNPFIFKDSIRHDEEDIPNHWIVPKPKNICIYIYEYTHICTSISSDHNETLFVFTHWKESLGQAFVQIDPKTAQTHTHTRTHMNFLWFQMKNTEHSSIVSYVFSLETSSLSLCHDELILWIFILNYCLWCIFPSWIR